MSWSVLLFISTWLGHLRYALAEVSSCPEDGLSKWTFTSRMPTPRTNIAFGQLNKTVYILGGRYTPDDNGNGKYSQFAQDVLRYDTDTGNLTTWLTHYANKNSNCSFACYGMCSFTRGKQIYVMGAWVPSSPSLSESVVFDVRAHTCVTLGRAMNPYYALYNRNDIRITSTCVYYDRAIDTMFLIGGLNNTNHTLETVFSYSFGRVPGWRRLPDLNSPRAKHSCAAIGDYMYVFGGITGKDEHDDPQWNPSIERLHYKVSNNFDNNTAPGGTTTSTSNPATTTTTRIPFPPPSTAKSTVDRTYWVTLNTILDPARIYTTALSVEDPYRKNNYKILLGGGWKGTQSGGDDNSLSDARVVSYVTVFSDDPTETSGETLKDLTCLRTGRDNHISFADYRNKHIYVFGGRSNDDYYLFSGESLPTSELFTKPQDISLIYLLMATLVPTLLCVFCLYGFISYRKYRHQKYLNLLTWNQQKTSSHMASLVLDQDVGDEEMAIEMLSNVKKKSVPNKEPEIRSSTLRRKESGLLTENQNQLPASITEAYVERVEMDRLSEKRKRFKKSEKLARMNSDNKESNQFLLEENDRIHEKEDDDEPIDGQHEEDPVEVEMSVHEQSLAYNNYDRVGIIIEDEEKEHQEFKDDIGDMLISPKSGHSSKKKKGKYKSPNLYKSKVSSGSSSKQPIHHKQLPSEGMAETTSPHGRDPKTVNNTDEKKSMKNENKKQTDAMARRISDSNASDCFGDENRLRTNTFSEHEKNKISDEDEDNQTEWSKMDSMIEGNAETNNTRELLLKENSSRLEHINVESELLKNPLPAFSPTTQT